MIFIFLSELRLKPCKLSLNQSEMEKFFFLNIALHPLRHGHIMCRLYIKAKWAGEPVSRGGGGKKLPSSVEYNAIHCGCKPNSDKNIHSCTMMLKTCDYQNIQQYSDQNKWKWLSFYKLTFSCSFSMSEADSPISIWELRSIYIYM